MPEWAPGPDIDQAADLSHGAVLELLWTEIAQGGMETRSVVDLVDEPRALTGTAPGDRVVLENHEIEVLRRRTARVALLRATSPIVALRT